jgi:hypothetical protein
VPDACAGELGVVFVAFDADEAAVLQGGGDAGGA